MTKKPRTLSVQARFCPDRYRAENSSLTPCLPPLILGLEINYLLPRSCVSSPFDLLLRDRVSLCCPHWAPACLSLPPLTPLTKAPLLPWYCRPCLLCLQQARQGAPCHCPAMPSASPPAPAVCGRGGIGHGSPLQSQVCPDLLPFLGAESRPSLAEALPGMCMCACSLSISRKLQSPLCHSFVCSLVPAPGPVWGP